MIDDLEVDVRFIVAQHNFRRCITAQAAVDEAVGEIEAAEALIAQGKRDHAAALRKWEKARAALAALKPAKVSVEL